MRPMLLLLALLGSVALPAAETEVKRLEVRREPADGRVRPGETAVIQVLVWGSGSDRGKTLFNNGRLRLAPEQLKLRDGGGWLSKPFRYQGDNAPAFAETSSGWMNVLESATGQFTLKDSWLYTAPDTPGTYEVEVEFQGQRAKTQITVDKKAASRREVEAISFPAEENDDRFLPLVEHYAPYIAQETWWEWKADIPTRFDYDGDWRGDNNWDDLPRGSSQAYVHYAVMETPTHWYLHYNLFHPRDYSDNCIAGTCHENDNEGLILTVRKDSNPFGTLLAMETLAHNNVYSYTADPRIRRGEHDVEGPITLVDESHPLIVVEAAGHGIFGGSSNSVQFDLNSRTFPGSTGITLRYTGKAERPRHAADREVGYALIPIERAWIARLNERDMWDAPFRYLPLGGRPGNGLVLPGSFLGRKEAANKAKPFWGWHDTKTQKRRVLATGQWALDPAYAITRDLTFPPDEEFSLRYVYHPFFNTRREEPLEQ